MPKINVYLPNELYERLVVEEFNVSLVCQRALRGELEQRAAEAGTLDDVSLFRDKGVHHKLDAIIHELRHIKSIVNTTNNKETYIMAILDDLQAAVAVDTDVTSSAITLLQGLAAQLAAAGTDEAALAAIRDSLNTNTQALADAVVQNTPAAPVEPV